MADRIGAYRNIIPVTSKANVRPDSSPEPEPVEPGLKWSKQSKFKYSTLEIDPVPEGGATGVTIRKPPIEEFETRVEQFPAAVKWKTEDYLVYHTVTGFPPPPGDSEGFATAEHWVEAWYFLGSDEQQEIVGYTSFGGGRVQERYKTREVEYYLHLTFEKGSIPRRQGVFHTYGEIPPLE